MRTVVAHAMSYLAYHTGHMADWLFEKFEWGWAYDLYVWCMRQSFMISERYGLDHWVPYEDDDLGT